MYTSIRTSVGPGSSQTASADPYLGTRMGAYVLLDLLGTGGMCNVYRARHVSRGTEHALKVLHAARAQHAVFAQRMLREAAAARRINHPNIIRVTEIGMAQGGPFLVMELLAGTTLHDVLRLEGKLPLPRAAHIVRQVARGLAAAHQAGLVHRDMKPGNIMLSPDPSGERVKILDFGIVRIADQEFVDDDPLAQQQLTRDDLVVGTPSYMAPEQFQSSHVGPEADLFSLGVVLYQMIAGRLPYEGSFQQIMAQQLTSVPNPLPDSCGLDELAFWLLERSPQNRPPASRVVEVIDHWWPIRPNAPVVPIAPPFFPLVPGQPLTPPPRPASPAPRPGLPRAPSSSEPGP